MSEKESPDPHELDDEVEQDDLADTGWRYSYGRFMRDDRHHFDEEGKLIPPKTGAERQKDYEQEQSQGDKKRPGWWLSEEVIKTITARQWEHLYMAHDKKSGRTGWKTKSDRIDVELRYMLRIVEAVEAKAKEVDGFACQDAIDLVLEKIAALEVPHIPLLSEEKIEAKHKEIYGS